MVNKMAKYEHKNNTGSAFINKNKREDFHSDLSGTALIDNKEYYVNVYNKKTQAGEPFISFNVKPKDSVPAKADPFSNTKIADDDSIPF